MQLMLYKGISLLDLSVTKDTKAVKTDLSAVNPHALGSK